MLKTLDFCAVIANGQSGASLRGDASAGECFHKGGVYWSAVRVTTARTMRAMEPKGKKTSYERSVKSLQENVTRAAPAMAAAYGLVGAILLFGALGYGLDRWLGTSWFLVGGLTLGVIVGFYELIKATYRK